MSPKFFPTQISHAVVPVSAFGLLLSAAQPGLARPEDRESLARLTEKHVRQQMRQEQRDEFRAQRAALRAPDTAAANIRQNSHQIDTLLFNNSNRHNAIRENNVRNRSEFLSNNGKFKGLNRGAQLDLTSDKRTIRVGENIFGSEKSVTITVGDQQKTFTAGAFVTPAEYIALQQKLEDNSQELILGTGGNALDGTVLLSTLSDAGEKIKASSLVVPVNVEAIGNFADRGDFKLKGDLVNSGSVYALSNKPETRAANIAARNITNTGTGLISSVVPSSVSNQFGEVNSTLDLNLSAEQRLTNYGRIESSGSLSLSGATVNNASANTGVGTVTAAKDVNINSAIVRNSGVVSATAGNINFNTAVESSISVDSTSGTFSATNGDINFRSASDSMSKIHTTLTGGDWLSKKLNIDSADGAVEVSVRSVTGQVNVDSGTASVVNQVGDLNIGSLHTTGDPLLFSAGDLLISNVVTNGAPVTGVAGGNITVNFSSGPGFNAINTSNTSGAAGDVLLVAGANFTQNGSVLTITGGTATGGNISIAGSFFGTINADGSTVDGDVTIIAYEGGAGQNGQITHPGAEGGTVNGFTNLTIIAPNDIEIGSFTSFNQTGSAALLANSQPVIVGGQVTVDQTTGAVLSGSFTHGAITDGAIRFTDTGYAAIANASLQIKGGEGGVRLAGLDADSISVTSLGAITRTAGSSVGAIARDSVVYVARGAININGNVATTSSNAQNAGNIVLISGADFDETDTEITINGASGVTGSTNMNLGGVPVGFSVVEASGLTGNLAGGDITLIAFANSSGAGTIDIATGDTLNQIRTGGSGTGTNGNLTIVAGGTSGTTIEIGDDIDLSGGQSGTGNMTVANATPVTTDPVIIAKTTADLTNSFLGGETQNAGIAFEETVTMDGGALWIQTGPSLTYSAAIPVDPAQFSSLNLISRNNITINTAISGKDMVQFHAEGIVTVNNTISANSVVITSEGLINAASAITARDSIVLVAGENIDTDALNTFNNLQNAGNITVVSGADFEFNVNEVTVLGASGAASTGISSNGNYDVSGGGGFDAGSLTVVAFADATGGATIDLTGGDIHAGGDGAGDNGNVTIISGQTSGTGIILQSVNMNTGAAETGSLTLATDTPYTAEPVQIDNVTGLGGTFIGGATQNATINAGTTNLDIDLLRYHSGDLTGIPAITGTFQSIDLGSLLAMSFGALSFDSIVIQTTDAVTFTNTVTAASNLSVVAGLNLTFNNDVTAPGGVLLVSGHNITFTTGATLSTSGSQAGNVTVVAGAAYDTNSELVAFTGNSATGGLIDFDNVDIDATGTGAGGTGGTVQLIAFSGSDDTGTVSMNGGSILTGGNAGGDNGNVIVVAGKDDATLAIQISTIDVTGGLSGTGDVDLVARTPNVLPEVTAEKATATVAGTFLGGADQPGTINVTNVTVDGGRLNIDGEGGAGTITGPLSEYSQNVTGNIDLFTITADRISITATGSIILHETLNAFGGIILVAGANISTSVAGPLQLNASSSISDGGNITMVAGADFDLTATGITINGATFNGGHILFQNNDVSGVLTGSTSLDGKGGNINMFAFYESTGFTNEGYIRFSSGGNIETGGVGAGANGNVTIVSGHAGGNVGVQVNAIDTTGGSGGGGNITLSNATPDTTPPIVISRLDLNYADIGSGSIVGGPIVNGSTSAGALTVHDAAVTITSGLDIALVGPIVATGDSTVQFSATRDIDLNGDIAAQRVSILAGDDVVLRQDIVARQGILVVAGHNIDTNIASPLTISTASTVGDAGNITMVAGATFSQTLSEVTITGATATGGRVNFAGNDLALMTARSTFSGGDGGDINLVAFFGSDNSGTVRTNGAPTILTGGSGNGTNGTFTAVAGHNAGGLGIEFNGVNTAGGTGGGGAIVLSNSTPNSGVVIEKTDAAISTGSFLGGTTQSGAIDTGLLTFGSASVNVRTALSANLEGAVGTGLYDVRVGQDVAVSGDINAGNISITAVRDIEFRQDLIAPGGILVVTGRNMRTFVSSPLTISSASNTGDAGSITMVAGATFNQDDNDITITGQSASGGEIYFLNNDLASMSARSTFAGGSGGDVNLIAFNGADNTGIVRNQSGGQIVTGGTGSGSNGDVTIVAGHNTAGFGIFWAPGVDTTGGLTGTGDILMTAAQPNATPNVVLDKSTGDISSGSFLGGATANGDVLAGTLSFDGSLARMESGNNVSSFNVIGTGNGDFQVRAGGGADLNGDISARNISVLAGTNLGLHEDLISRGAIVLVAGGNISSSVPNPLSIRTNSSTGNAGGITMVAGAAFSETPGDVTITGASATGGSIVFQNNDLAQLSSTSTALNGSGGDINMVAFWVAGQTGEINTNSGPTILTGGSGSGANGNFTAVAGQNAGVRGISVDGINTTGGASGTGDITLTNSTPNAPVTVSKTTGEVATGTFLGGATTQGSIDTGVITVNGANVEINGGIDVTLGGTAGSGEIDVVAGRDLTHTADLVGDSISLAATRDITLTNDVIAPGGIVIVAGHNIRTQIASPLSISTETTGDAGDITMIAGAAFTNNPNDLTITGASATGGRIEFQNNDVQMLSASSTGGNGDGGTINMYAFTGSENTGTISTNGLPAIEAGGNGTGDNGAVNMIAGHNGGGNAIVTSSIDITGGANGTGEVNLQTSTPSTTPNPIVVSKTDGSVLSGDALNGPAVPGNIVVTTINASGGEVNVVSGQNVQIGTINNGGGVTGNGGSVYIETNGTAPLTIGSAGTNSVQTINANGGSTSGNAGEIVLSSQGTQPLNITSAGAINLGVTNGDGGTLSLYSDTAINLSFNTINVSGAGTGPHNGGNIYIAADTLTFPGNLQLTANGVNGGDGGTINVNLVDPITLGSGTGQILITATGPNADVYVQSAGIITVATGGTVTSGGSLELSSPAGIVNNGTVTGDTINLTVSGTANITGTGVFTGGELSIVAGTGTVNINTDVTALFVNSSGPVTISEDDDIVLNGITATTFTLTAGGDILQGAGDITAGTITLTSTGGGDIGATGNPILINNGASAVNLSANTQGGNVFINSNGTGTVNLGSDPGFTENNYTLVAAGPVTTTSDITVTGTLDITTNYLTNNNDLTAGVSINIQSNPGSGLTVDGGAGAGGTFTAPQINLTATNGNLVFVNDQTYNGTVNMQASGDPTSSVIISAGSDVTVNGIANVITGTFIENGNLTADEINFISPFMTIANSTGNITLDDNINLVGDSFVIIAAGDILAGSGFTTINLSDPSGIGGSLTLVAGYTFTPATTGTQQDGLTYTNFTESTIGGDIVLGNVTINTSSTNGSAGSVLAVASAGSTNQGAIALGNITASGGLNGADVVVIGQGGVTVGTVSTSGTNSSGSVILEAAAPTIDGTPSVTNGVLSGGTWESGTYSNGAVTAGAIDAGTGGLFMTTNGGTITTNGILSALGINLDAGSGTINLGNLTSITANVDDSGNGGSISLKAEGAIQYNSASGSPLVLNADGTGSGNGGSIEYFTLDATPTFIGQPTKAPKPPANFLSLSAQGGTTGGDGGGISVRVSGNLTANSAAMLAAPRASAGDLDGANYDLGAGIDSSEGGALVVLGSLDADGVNNGQGGSIVLNAANKKAFTVGSGKVPKNGVQGNLSAAGGGGIISVSNRFGGLTISSSAALTSDSLSLFAGAKGKITTGKGVVLSAADNIFLSADQGTIGGSKPLLINTAYLNALGGSTIGVSNSFNGDVEIGTTTAGKGFTYTSTGTGDLTIYGVTATGSIEITGGTGGTLEVADSSSVVANNGEIILTNLDTTGGAIRIGEDANVETAGTKGKDVTITIGEAPKKPVAGTVPAGVTEDIQDGEIFYGQTGGVVVEPLGTATVAAWGKAVIFNNSSTNIATNKITLGDGSLVKADPPVTTTSTSARSSEAPPMSVLNAAISMAPSAPANIDTNSGATLLNQLASAASSTSSIDRLAMQSSSIMDGRMNLNLVQSNLVGTDSVNTNNVQSAMTEEQIFDALYTVDAFIWSDEDFGLRGGSVLPAQAKKDALQASAQVSNSNETATMRSGHVLFAPQKDTNVVTPFGTVEVAAGSMALVMANQNGLAVYDLHDTRKGAVKIKTNGHEVALSPGRCTLVAKASNKRFHDINPLEAVGYRGLSEKALGSELKLYNSEFCTIHAMQAVKPLKEIANANHPKARKLSTQLMKTSAVLMHLGASSEYEFFSKAQVTAYAK